MKKLIVFLRLLALALVTYVWALLDKHTDIDSDILSAIVLVPYIIIVFGPSIIKLKREFNNRALVTAAQDNNAVKVARLIKAGADVNAKDDEGRTALMLAAMENAADAARVLTEAGADVNAKTEGGVTILMVATMAHAADVARMLIEAGADMDAEISGGVTMLMLAAMENAADVARVLIEAGADIDAKTDDGETALIAATHSEATDVIRVLIEHMRARYDVDFSEFGEDNINRLFIYYKDRFENLMNNDFIMPNSKLLMFLEQDSGSISQNLGETVKKNLNVGKVLRGGVSGLVGTGIELAKAAGGRVAKSVVNEVIGDRDFMLLTDKNVVLVKNGAENAYDFEDAMDIFNAKQDEVLAGVVDVYDDCENIVLDNIPQMEWNSFMATLRKLKKEAKRPVAIKSNSNGAIAEIERKLMKLKTLVEKGLLSQDDFDAQKSKLLAAF